MEDALKRLDNLTQEEARMAAAQNLKATHIVDERVRGVANAVVAVDNRVARATHAIDERVREVGEQVLSVDDKVASVDDKVAEVVNGTQVVFSQARVIFNLICSDGKEAKQVIKQTAKDVDKMKRSSSLNLIRTTTDLHIISETQLRGNIRKWLSPPNPSTNHNIACGTHHKQAATWFFQGSIYREWKSTGSLLWIHGKRTPCPTSPSITF